MTRAPLARITSRCLARLGAHLCTTVVGLLAWGFVPTAAAQDAGAQAPPALTAPPPARIGQLFYTSGNARMRMDRVSSWEPAVLHTPLTVGTGLATQGGGAEVRVGSAALHLAPDAQVIWHELDDTSLHVEVVSGMVGLRVRAIAAGERVLISAGGVKVHVRKPGYYRIRQVPPGTRLAVWVLEGQARVAPNPQEAVLGPNQHVVVDRRNAGVLFSGANDEARPFDGIVEMRNRRSGDSFSMLHVSAEMTGVEALDGHGKWRTEADHGAGAGCSWPGVGAGCRARRPQALRRLPPRDLCMPLPWWAFMAPQTARPGRPMARQRPAWAGTPWRRARSIGRPTPHN